MTISLTSTIQLRPLSKQLEDGVLLIGYGGQFLELPAEGLHFISWLEQGMPLEAARQRFEAEFSPFPQSDLLEILDAFQEYDFIASVDGQAQTPAFEVAATTHSDWVSPRLAQALFSTPMLLLWLVIVLPAIGLWVSQPDLWPRWGDYFWIEYNFIIILVSLPVWLTSMVSHELAHLMAARAKGIEATITWTRRLGVIPMSQTIMHTIWTVPRQARLIPIAAGIMLDLIRISGVIYLLTAHALGAVAIPLWGVKFLKFYLLVSTFGFTSQFWLFSQMDGYYLFSALLGQRNLQADTYDWFKFKLGRLPAFHPPAGGMRFIYGYAIITLIGGGAFMGQFLGLNLPIKIRVLSESFFKMMAGSAHDPLAFADGVAAFVSQMIDIGLLGYVYWRRL